MRKRTVILASGLIVCALLVAISAGRRGAAPHTTAEPRYVTPSGPPPRIAVVLSGGSLRGFAHVGVFKVLEAEGIRPDLIVGSSSGAIVGALAASGMTAAEIERASNEVGFDLLSAWTIPSLGLLNASPVHDFVHRRTRSHLIEEFPLRFAAVATDIDHGCLAIFNAGDPGKAVQASVSMPMLFRPTEVGGRRFADGNLVSPVPVDVARALGARLVVAVDVIYDPRETRVASLIDAAFQPLLISVRELARREAASADLLIEPKLPAGTDVRLENRAQLVAAGEQAARSALPALRALLQQRGEGTATASKPRACGESGAR